ISGTWVPADEIQHRRANVDCNVKRGRPTFWPARKLLTSALETLLNIGETADVQTRVAWIRRHVGATKDGLEALRASEADYTRSNPRTGKIESVKRLPRAAVIDQNANTENEFPSAGINVTEYAVGVQAELRGAAAMVVMPEFMFTADASNANYSST